MKNVKKMSNKELVHWLWARSHTCAQFWKEPGSQNIIDECKKDIVEAKKEILHRMRKSPKREGVNEGY